jgi:DnaJ-domain-containing protein 1
VSIGRRFFDLARANLNALLDKAGGETSIDELSDDELEAELERRRERRRRETEERAAAQRAAEHARQRAAASAAAAATRGASAGSAHGRGSSTSGQQQKRQAPPSSTLPERRLRELYAQLEVPYGASFDEVKKSFRRLMRKYHPDLHLSNPQKHKTATQLTMSLTQAYNELEMHLVGGPNKAGH